MVLYLYSERNSFLRYDDAILALCDVKSWLHSEAFHTIKAPQKSVYSFPQNSPFFPLLSFPQK